jgi:hypothetical protein
VHDMAAGAWSGEVASMVHGRYQTIDLGRLGYERVEAGEPYREEGDFVRSASIAGQDDPDPVQGQLPSVLI